MDAVYLKIRKIARDIVSRYPQPDFYGDHASEFAESKQFYNADQSIGQLRQTMADRLGNNLGHGLGHVEKVAIDAGTLVIIESRLADHAEPRVHRDLLLAQCAGLLHDICRKEQSHAEKGAEIAGQILSAYPLAPDEIGFVCAAIRNHEAFTRMEDLPVQRARLISDCLYDADKFRWGPDNFTHTLWDMIEFSNPSLMSFVDHYPAGMAVLKKVRRTFRSKTGRHYGPQFIDIGIAIGEALYEVILTQFIDQK